MPSRALPGADVVKYADSEPGAVVVDAADLELDSVVVFAIVVDGRLVVLADALVVVVEDVMRS